MIITISKLANNCKDMRNYTPTKSFSSFSKQQKPLKIICEQECSSPLSSFLQDVFNQGSNEISIDIVSDDAKISYGSHQYQSPNVMTRKLGELVEKKARESRWGESSSNGRLALENMGSAQGRGKYLSLIDNKFLGDFPMRIPCRSYHESSSASLQFSMASVHEMLEGALDVAGQSPGVMPI